MTIVTVARGGQPDRCFEREDDDTMAAQHNAELPFDEEPIGWEELSRLHMALDDADTELQEAKSTLKERKEQFEKASDALRAAGRRVRYTALAERNRVANRRLRDRAIDPDTGEVRDA